MNGKKLVMKNLQFHVFVHDNLLADLYSLTLDNICVDKIDNEYYLINKKSGKDYQVGLRAKIPNKFLPIGKDYNELTTEKKEEIFEELKERLYFSNVEILFTNILLSKYMKLSQKKFDISFKEIEKNYRRNSRVTGSQISESNYKRYIETINKLVDKELFLKTNGNFRDKQYGVRNLNFNQPFLTLFYPYHYKKNNIVFSYSFGRFGEVLKLSRRFSNIIPRSAFCCRLNQSILHSIYYFLGREIFWEKFHLKKIYGANSTRANFFELDISKLSYLVQSNTKDSYGYSIGQKINILEKQANKSRDYRRFIKNINKALTQFKQEGIIADFDLEFIVNETEEFERKHEFDYDEQGNFMYIFNIDDISKDIDVKITIRLEPAVSYS